MQRIDRAIYLALVILGVVATYLAVRSWVPDSEFELPSRADVEARALRDAEDIGYRVDGSPRIQVTAGSRLFLPIKPFEALVREEPDAAARLRRIRQASPVRLAARFRTAIGPNGTSGDLVLEYDADGKLAGALFGLDGFVVRGLPTPGGAYFADDLAGRLLEGPLPSRQETGLGGVDEFLYRADPSGESRPTSTCARTAPGWPNAKQRQISW